MSNDTSQQPTYAELQAAYSSSESENESLKRQLAWFQKQMFGSKSERRLVDPNPDQLLLAGLLGEASKPVPVEKETITYERGKALCARLTVASLDSPNINCRASRDL